MSLDFSGTACVLELSFNLTNAAAGDISLSVDGAAPPATFHSSIPFITPTSLSTGSHTVAVELSATSAVPGTTDLYVTVQTPTGTLLHPYSTNTPGGNPFIIPGLTIGSVPSTAFVIGVTLV